MLAKLWLFFLIFNYLHLNFIESQKRNVKCASGSKIFFFFFQLVSECIYLNSSLLVWLRGRKLNQLAD